MINASRLAVNVIVALLLFLGATDCWAANTIQISSQQVGTGSITCSGTYTLDTGWSVSSITLIAWNNTGGAQHQKGATYASGNWNQTTITGLDATVNSVFVQMTIMNGSNTQNINSAPTTLRPN